MIVVSACLLGRNCKYNGGNSRSQNVIGFLEGQDYVEVCPELMGGLEAPRPPAELMEGRVVDREGKDVSVEFRRGAEAALEAALSAAEEKNQAPELAILKARSPSCGCREIYDGTFSGTLTAGNGVFASLLLERGIPVISEEEVLEELTEEFDEEPAEDFTEDDE